MIKLRKNRKTIITVVVAVVMAVVISLVSCYVLAENLINSKDVVYEDNSNLVADNVQDAIDGTCTKIDTRLSTIEDKLYTVKNFGVSNNTFTATTTLDNTGISITFPAKSYCSVTVTAMFYKCIPTIIALTPRNNTEPGAFVAANYNDGTPGQLSVTYSSYFENDTTYYIVARHKSEGVGWIDYSGFCATKYK